MKRSRSVLVALCVSTLTIAVPGVVWAIPLTLADATGAMRQLLRPWLRFDVISNEPMVTAARPGSDAARSPSPRARIAPATFRYGKSADTNLLRATRYVFEQRPSDSREAIERTLARDPHAATAHLTLGRLLLADGEYARAQAEIEQAIALEPTRIESHLALAASHRLRGDWPAAETVLKHAATVLPNDGLAQSQLGELYVLQGKNDEALALFTTMSANGPDTWAAKKRLAELYVEFGRIKDAASLIYGLLAINTSDLELHYLHARLLLAKGDVPKGTHQLQQVLREGPSFALAGYQLALARVREHQFETAAAELTECLRHKPDFVQARYVLAQLHLQAGHYDPAYEQAVRIAAVRPQSYEVRALVSDAALGRGDGDTARRVAEQLVRDFPTRYDAHYRLGRALAGSGRFSEARAELERALAMSPTSTAVLADLVTLGDASDATALQRVQAHVDAHPDVGAARLLLGYLTIGNGDVDRGIAILEQTAQQDHGRHVVDHLLGAAYAIRGRLPDARARFERVIAADPTVVEAYMLLGVIAEAEGQPAQAVKRYRQALDLDSKFAPAANNLAWNYAERDNDLDTALELARDARANMSDDPYVADTLGWITYRRRLYATAIPYLRESATAMPANPEVRYHLGMAYLRSGKLVRARAELRAALESNAFPSIEAARQALKEIES
jgi:Flp pilus assembly protein TadD